MMVAERQREQRTAIARVRKSILRHIKMLEKELAEIDNDVGTILVRGSPAWRDKEDLLDELSGDRSIPWRGRSLPKCQNLAA